MIEKKAYNPMISTESTAVINQVPNTRQEFVIKNELDIITARQAARELARQSGFKPVVGTWIATVVSELARNILLYAREGTITIDAAEKNDKKYIEIIARDQGPGIADIDLAMSDGYSTRQGLGMGLSGSKRLMDDFQIESRVGQGTIIKTRKWLQ